MDQLETAKYDGNYFLNAQCDSARIAKKEVSKDQFSSIRFLVQRKENSFFYQDKASKRIKVSQNSFVTVNPFLLEQEDQLNISTYQTSDVSVSKSINRKDSYQNSQCSDIVTNKVPTIAQEDQYFTPHFIANRATLLDTFDLDSHTFYPNNRYNQNYQHDSIQQQLQNHCQQNQWEIMQDLRNIDCWNQNVKIKCRFKHSFTLQLDQLMKYKCSKCQVLVQKIQEHVENQGGKILGPIDPILQIQCKEGHEFNINYKCIFRKWCSICHKLKKSYEKAQKNLEYKQKFQKNLEKQQELFNSSKQRVFVDQSTEKIKKDNEFQYDVLYAFKQMETQIDEKANARAAEQLPLNPDCTQQDIFYVYKIMLLCDGILQLYFEALEKNELKLEYKRYVKKIHPDKNPYHQSGQAFRKLQFIFESAYQKTC